MSEQEGTHPLLVLALFDDERDADEALSQLAIAGMSQDALKVIDKPDLEDAEPPIPYPAYRAGASLGHLRPDPEPLASPDIAEGAGEAPVRRLEELLRGMELDGAEARYYAGAVYEGGTLVIIRVSGEGEADQVRQMLAEAGATNFTG